MKKWNTPKIILLEMKQTKGGTINKHNESLPANHNSSLG